MHTTGTAGGYDFGVKSRITTYCAIYIGKTQIVDFTGEIGYNMNDKMDKYGR